MPPEESVEVESQDVQDAAPVESAPQAASAPVDSAAVEAPQTDYWGAFRSLPEFNGQDERAVASRLYEALQQERVATQQLQQYQSIIPAASEYLTFKEPFQQWMQERQAKTQQQAPAPQPEQPSWWNPPQVRDAYKQYLTRDENGREVIDQNAPLEARHQLAEYQAYKAGFAKKFLENPEEALGPMVDRVASERAEQIVGERLQRMRDEDFVDRLEKENADWLYDQNRQPTAEGFAVQQYIGQAKQLGIKGAEARWDFARKMVERDLMLAEMQGRAAQQQQNVSAPVPNSMQPPINPGEQQARQNMEFLRQQAMRTASQRPAENTNARVPNKPMTFAEMLTQNLKTEGLL